MEKAISQRKPSDFPSGMVGISQSGPCYHPFWTSQVSIGGVPVAAAGISETAIRSHMSEVGGLHVAEKAARRQLFLDPRVGISQKSDIGGGDQPGSAIKLLATLRLYPESK